MSKGVSMRCLLNLLLVLGSVGLLAADGTSLWAQPFGKGSIAGTEKAAAQTRARISVGMLGRILQLKRHKAAKSLLRKVKPKLQPVSSQEPKTPSVSPGNSRPMPRVTVDLPEEYHDQDTDRDGQIGLYEWPRGKFAEFFKLDRNHDGFLTPRELIRAAAESRLGKDAE